MRLEAIPKQNREIFAALPDFKEFYLAGGTALSLQIGHRVSVDFDLFSDKEIVVERKLIRKNIDFLISNQ